MLDQRPMKHFFNSRTLHATAALVLMAWLFALASGIANACLLEGARGTHAHAAGVEESPHTHAATQSLGDAPDIAGNTDESPNTRALCLDSCDERTHALAKKDASPDQPHLAALTVVAIVWLATQPMASTVRVQRDHHAEPFDVPIRIRYSRLTL